VRWAVLALVALALSGCETSAEKSAKLEKAALARLPKGPAPSGLSVTKPSRVLKVLSSTILHDSEGTAAVVTLRNDSPSALQAVPLEITLTGASGSTLYSNTGSGLSPSLTSVSYIPAHGTTTWVDDQVQAAETPTAIRAVAGEGIRAAGQPLGQTLLDNRGRPMHAAGHLAVDRWQGEERVQMRLVDVADVRNAP